LHAIDADANANGKSRAGRAHDRARTFLLYYAWTAEVG